MDLPKIVLKKMSVTKNITEESSLIYLFRFFFLLFNVKKGIETYVNKYIMDGKIDLEELTCACQSLINCLINAILFRDFKMRGVIA